MKNENTKIIKYIGERIRAYRTDINMSRDKAAELLGISKRTLASYERGEREVTMPMLIKMAEIYRTTYTKLTNYENILDDMGNLIIG